MDKIQKIFFFVVLVIILTMTSADGLRCYTCSSPMADNCKDGSQMSIVDCDTMGGNFLGGQSVCLKTVREVNGSPFVMKSCAWQGSVLNPCASYVQQSFEHCSTCTTELCNSATSFKSSFITGLAFVLLSLLTRNMMF